MKADPAGTFESKSIQKLTPDEDGDQALSRRLPTIADQTICSPSHRTARGAHCRFEPPAAPEGTRFREAPAQVKRTSKVFSSMRVGSRKAVKIGDTWAGLSNPGW